MTVVCRRDHIGRGGTGEVSERGIEAKRRMVDSSVESDIAMAWSMGFYCREYGTCHIHVARVHPGRTPYSFELFLATEGPT